jgi:Ni2+-binding GTPase involved in maturation of urease and hydrogenase
VGVGGFLGAGKTTTILSAAARLRARGVRVSVITNDQATGLVDTAAARAALEAQDVAEIAGGCFCCRFDDLARTLFEVIDRARPDVILAEAVGSCTDLAATVYQPLRQLDLAPVRLGPLTVVADATRLRAFRRFAALPQLPQSVGYLYGQQMNEADVLLLNKIDLLAPDEAPDLAAYLEARSPGVPVLPISALDGTGLDAWLDRLVSQPSAGERVLTLDYDEYAAAEACLGWLNLEGSCALRGVEATVWAGAVLTALASRARAAGAEIAHAKLRLAGSDGSCAANLVGLEQGPDVRDVRDVRVELDELSGAPGQPGELVLNARVATEPETLRAWVMAALDEADAATGAATGVSELQCFSPARPVPTYRLQPV